MISSAPLLLRPPSWNYALPVELAGQETRFASRVVDFSTFLAQRRQTPLQTAYLPA